ncbi:hypothetical protein AZE42_09398, partial [Rhizopogon vesiculosus]
LQCKIQRIRPAVCSRIEIKHTHHFLPSTIKSLDCNFPIPTTMTSHLDDPKNMNQGYLIGVNDDEYNSSDEVEFAPEPADLAQCPITESFKYDEDDSSDEEEEFAPEPEDLIQVPIFPERGPQEKSAARAPDPKDKNKKQANQPPKEPNIIKRPTDKEPKKISGAGKYK